MTNKFASALKGPQQEPVRTSVRPSPGRNGRKHIGGYFDPAVSTQPRLAVEENSTVQRLLEEALDLLFQARMSSSNGVNQNCLRPPAS